MIQIEVNNTILTLPEGTELLRDRESNILDRELKGTDFTYPATLPLTDEVKRALELPHMIASTNTRKDYDANIIIDGLFFSSVKLRLIQVDTGAQSASISLIGDYGSFATVIGDKKLTQLELDGVRTIGVLGSSSTLNWATNVVLHYQDCDTVAHLNAIADGTIDTDYRFPMCVDNKADLQYVHSNNPNLDFAAGVNQAFRNILNPYWKTDTGVLGYLDPVRQFIEQSLRPNVTAPPEITSNERYFWVPMFKLSYVLQHCFTETGYTVSGDIFSHAGFTEKLIYNTFSINKCYFTETLVTGTPDVLNQYVTHDATSIRPWDHMPDMKITDFLVAVGKWFNLVYSIDHTNHHVTVRCLNNMVPSGNIIDLTNVADPQHVINYEKTEFANGYEFSFDKDDNNPTDETLDSKYIADHLIGTVDNYYPLRAGNPTPPFPFADAGDLVYVKAENLFYEYGGVEWIWKAHNLGNYKTSDEDDLQKISTKATSLAMYRFGTVAFSGTFQSDPLGANTGSIYEYNMMMPYSNIGVRGQNLLGIHVLPDFTLPASDYRGNVFNVMSNTKPMPSCVFVNYLGKAVMIDGVADLYPMASASIYDADGNVAGSSDTPCSWNVPLTTPKGLYRSFWKGFTDALKDSPQADWNVLMNPYMAANLKPDENFVMIRDLLYLCRRDQTTMPFNRYSKLTLVRV
jgi:hypothetical protein